MRVHESTGNQRRLLLVVLHSVLLVRYVFALCQKNHIGVQYRAVLARVLLGNEFTQITLFFPYWYTTRIIHFDMDTTV